MRFLQIEELRFILLFRVSPFGIFGCTPMRAIPLFHRTFVKPPKLAYQAMKVPQVFPRLLSSFVACLLIPIRGQRFLDGVIKRRSFRNVFFQKFQLRVEFAISVRP